MNRTLLFAAGIAVIVLGVVASSALFTVQQTQQAIVLQFGNFIRDVKEPGLHMKVPFIQDVQYYEKRVLNLDPSAERVILSGQKPLLVDSFIRYRIVDPLQFFKTVRTEQAVKDRLEPILNSAHCTVTASSCSGSSVTTGSTRRRS